MDCTAVITHPMHARTRKDGCYTVLTAFKANCNFALVAHPCSASGVCVCVQRCVPHGLQRHRRTVGTPQSTHAGASLRLSFGMLAPRELAAAILPLRKAAASIRTAVAGITPFRQAWRSASHVQQVPCCSRMLVLNAHLRQDDTALASTSSSQPPTTTGAYQLPLEALASALHLPAPEGRMPGVHVLHLTVGRDGLASEVLAEQLGVPKVLRVALLSICRIGACRHADAM